MFSALLSIQARKIAGSCGDSVQPFEELPDFFIAAAPCPNPPAVCRSPSFSMSSPAFVMVFGFHYIDPSMHEVTFPCGFGLHFPGGGIMF